MREWCQFALYCEMCFYLFYLLEQWITVRGSSLCLSASHPLAVSFQGEEEERRTERETYESLPDVKTHGFFLIYTTITRE